MKPAVRAAVFLLLYLFTFTSLATATEHSLQELAQETQKFAASYVRSDAAPAKPEQAAILLQAAEIMSAADQCDTAMTLYRQSAFLAEREDATFWLSLAKAAACVRRWPEASQSSWQAWQAADTPAMQKHALAFLGKALEKRTTVWDNWTPAAINVYELLAKLGDDSGEIDRLHKQQEEALSAEQKQQEEELARKREAEKAEQEKRLADLRRKQLEDSTLKVQSTAADSDNSLPKLCLRFNEELPKPDSFHYGDYVQISPTINSDFSIDDRRLCIGGAAWGTSYSVTVRSGMKVKERTLPETVTLTVETEHRSPALWFNQSDYILADHSSRGIGLNTVNVDKVQLQLFRIHERNILGNFVRENFRRKLSGYDIEQIKETVGEEVWQGSTEILSPVRDQITTSNVLLPQDVLAIAPGLYVLVAEQNKAESDEEDERRWEGQASQWIVVTDIGMTTYQGSDGLTVAARSLETALPIAGLEIGLYAKNNTPLAKLSTDEQGVARFAPGLLKGKGGQAAVHLMALDSKHGFTFLQLEQAPFDLSDRGVSGRSAPGPLDAYLYTERGIYRPGETVNLTAIVRDRIAHSAACPPMTLRVNGPDGKVLIERLLQPDPAGGYADTINLANSARSGNWTAALYADVEAKPVGQTSFEVKSFKPPRLEVRLESQGILSPASKTEVGVQADYYYGSPGSDLSVKANMELHYDPHPFADFADFYFGRDKEELGLAAIDLPSISTDAKGHGVLSLSLEGQSLNTLQPLKAVVRADVLDIDGRAVTATTSVPVQHLKEYLGLKPSFTDLHIPEQSEAKFAIIALNEQGQAEENGKSYWRLVHEEIDYQWFRKDGEWGYEEIVRDQEAQRGQLTWDKAGPVPLAVPTEWGRYRLELLNKDKTLLTSLRFTAGEQLVGESDTPDSVKVVLDRQSYKVGDTAKLTLTSPYLGQASLVLANTTVNGLRNFTLSGKEQTIEIPVEDGWGAGVYALLTVYRPGKDQQKGADRAVGLIWLPVDSSPQRLEVTVNAPEQVRPRQVLQVPVAVKGAESGSEIRLTLAAVDEGVLQLTNFVSPNPLTWFFGKQQLGLDIRDMYGQLIIPPDSKPLTLRSGAGEDALRGAPQSNVKVVSLFSGVVKVGADGTATVPLAIPDFNGKLRLMAVAWSKEKTGAISQAMRVNDPVVISPSLPRYLADGDQSSIQLLIENIDGPVGQYQATWQAEGAVKLASLESSAAVVQLQPGKRQSLSFPVTASGIGSGKLHLLVNGPQGYSYAGDFDLNVRGKYLPTLTRTYSKIEPGAVITLNKETLGGLYPATAKVALSISSAPNVDVAGLLGELDRYPHGCLEQLTSRAMPLLYANQLAERFAYPVDKNLPDRVQGAIDLILQKQRGEGSFGLWSDSDDEEPWLSAYAMDFLGRAREKGFAVPDYFYKKGLAWLTDEVKHSDREDKHLEALAYAHWVLARAGQARHEDARYLFDTRFDKINSPLAQAQLAGTLALLGDRDRAIKGLKAALRSADTESASWWWSYGSRLRDLASIISVLGETGLKQVDPASAWQELTTQLSKRKYFSTQEQAALIMAALTLDKGQPLDLEITETNSAQVKPDTNKPSLFGRFFSALSLNSDKPKEETKKAATEKKTSFFSLNRSGAMLLDQPVTLRNKGQAAVWAVITVQGAPINEPPAMENGFTIQRSWYTTAGKPLSLDKVRQSELAVVLVEGEAKDGGNYHGLLIDLLPAGFEIEKAVNGKEAEIFTWLPELSPFRYTDARDDRFVVAFDTEQLKPLPGINTLRPFSFAYLVRAVTPGTYTLPPSEVEAMYRPEYRARNKAELVQVIKAETR